MAQAIKDFCDDQTGRVSYQVGKFSYSVEDYDTNVVVIHKNDASNPALPIFVRQVTIKTKVKERYCRWEEVCEAAWRMAKLQSRA